MTRGELPHVALSRHAHNREGLHRTDERWLAEHWGDPSTQVLVLAGSRVRTRQGALDWVPAAEAPEGRRVLLGRRDGVTRFAVLRPEEDAGADEGSPGERWESLRTLLVTLADDEEGPEHSPWLFHAVGMAEWHRATRFCPRCGGGLHSGQAGHELRCADCGKAQFPRTDPAVIMAVTSGPPGSPDERVLLGRQRTWPEGRWSTLAGFCEPGETLEDAVRREVAEEVGVRVGEVGYFGSQPWPLPSSLMVAFTAQALTTDIDVDGAEIAEAAWFTREELRDGMASGRVRVPTGVSVSASLLQSWFGEDLTGGW